MTSKQEQVIQTLTQEAQNKFPGLVEVDSAVMDHVFDIRDDALSSKRVYQHLVGGVIKVYSLDSQYFRQMYIPDRNFHEEIHNLESPLHALGIINVTRNIYHPDYIYEPNLFLQSDKAWNESVTKIFEQFEANQGSADSPLDELYAMEELLKVEVESIYGTLEVYVEKNIQTGGFVYGFVQVPYEVAPLKIMMIRVYVVGERLVCQAFMGGSAFADKQNEQAVYAVASCEDKSLRVIEFNKYVSNIGAIISDHGTVSLIFKDEKELRYQADRSQAFIIPVYPNQNSVLNEIVRTETPSNFATLNLTAEVKKPLTLWARIKNYFTS